ncbi:MAG TPA: type II toxin-antitoxin system VapC family toxin [Gemmatimonadaceae bacterium]|nr:type II toxin-antitoxin system VapC family toxin [Gemmatimonadaceae bacterium]
MAPRTLRSRRSTAAAGSDPELISTIPLRSSTSWSAPTRDVVRPGLSVILCDVNVLVYAFRVESPRHAEFRDWLRERAAAAEPFGVADLVLSGVLRVLTHPRVFEPATPLNHALAFAAALRAQPNSVILRPGPRHWDIFTQLCTAGRAKGNLVADAFLAALAIEHGCEWITTDRDFARFPGLRWRHPLDVAIG